MTQRKNFDSFTAQHKLREAQEEFAQAVYRFRAAEEVNAPNRITLKREMEFLDGMSGTTDSAFIAASRLMAITWNCQNAP